MRCEKTAPVRAKARPARNPKPATATRAGREAKPAAASKGEKGSGKGQDGKGGSRKEERPIRRQGKRRRERTRRRARGEERQERFDKREGGGDENESDEAKNDGGSERNHSSSSSQLGAALEKIAGVLKWIVFAIVAIVVVCRRRSGNPALSRAVHRLGAAAARCARGTGGPGSVGQEGEARTEDRDGCSCRSVRNGHRRFTNSRIPSPTAPRSAATRPNSSPTPLKHSTAWAWDRDAAGELPETPLEFLARLADLYPDLVEVLTPSRRSTPA